MKNRTSKFGSDLLLDVLASEGINHIFGNPGTTEMPILNSLRDHPEIQYILGLQEAAVVAMADGYAKASGRPAFVNLHTAGGLGHAMGALLHSHIARTPMLVTAGQQDTRHILSDPLLYGNALKMSEPTVKWACELSHPHQIPPLVRRALHATTTPPAGPVFLSLPIDVLTAETAEDAGFSSSINRLSTAGGLQELAFALSGFPPGGLVVISGDEVDASNAKSELVCLIEMLGARVYGPSWPGTMSFPSEHPLWCGNLPTTAAEMHSALSGAKAVLIVGENPFIPYLYSEGRAVPDGLPLFQLTQDASEAGRNYTTELACIGNVKTSLQALLPLIIDRTAHHQEAISSIRAIAQADRERRLAGRDARLLEQKHMTPILPFVAAGEALRALGDQVIVVDEAPATMHHTRAFLERTSVRRYFFMRSAILGWGLPASVGVSLGAGRAPVVALLGDGSALYTPQGFWSAARLKVPVTFVVMNNAEYNILKRYSVAQGYERSGGSSIAGMELNDPAIDFQALAAAFGLPSRRIDYADEIEPTISAAVQSGKPNLVEITIGNG
ncbi:benzoylformate decarboxylase [Phyllobacterium ifriqiyense]|uniref:Benzoylformate decarboxylase n=1 Tax=Phyllobacterium ifriqiyense TaxID=314238 RepID=A0ABU0S984_9HYPH|nr:thiamine pyrophosphate-binding protein [Phyllobacterium ifriqiyense]MDQ0996293.1 benzoylformate decarboxylase [Phyllobacterium ifriqiyense]